MRRLAVTLLRRDKTCQRSLNGKLRHAALAPDDRQRPSLVDMRQPWSTARLSAKTL